jgi:hypothetical protein
MRKLVKVGVSTVAAATALVVCLIGASVHTFNALTDETLIAQIEFERVGDLSYLAHLRTGNGCDERLLAVLGDQWRIDAQFLKWKYWATLLGLDAQYRLERFEGRYRTVAAQNTEPTLAHDLEPQNAIDVVDLAGWLGSLNFLIDATYGSSTYHEIDTTRRYDVYRTQTGIITRSALLPRGAGPARGPLPISVVHGCGAKPPLMTRFLSGTDAAVIAAMRLVGAKAS